MKQLELIGLEDTGEIALGDSIGRLICDACLRQKIELRNDDVLVVAQKIVSKAEGRIVVLDDIQPSARAMELAAALDKEPELVEVILRDSRRAVGNGVPGLITGR